MTILPHSISTKVQQNGAWFQVFVRTKVA